MRLECCMYDYTRIDSCRNCGEGLDVLSNCLVCDKPAKFQCSHCFHYVDDPIHTECIILDESL